jgi:hypothetical protein
VTCDSLANGEKLDAGLRSLNVLGGHPDPDVRRTVAKHDTPVFFELPQQTNNSPIREDQVSKVQRNGPVDRDCVEQLAQLPDILGMESTAHRQHDGAPVSRPLNLEHRPHSGRNCRSNRQRLNIGSVADTHAVQISPVARTWLPLGSGTPWRAGAKATLVDLQQANLRLERRTREPQPCGRAGGTRHLPPTRPERLFDNLFFVRGQPAGQTKPAFGDGTAGKPAFVNREFVAVGYDDRSLNDVLQFANIPRPWICFQPIKRPPADALESLACLPAVATDEVFDEQGNVFPPFPVGAAFRRETH